MRADCKPEELSFVYAGPHVTTCAAELEADTAAETRQVRCEAVAQTVKTAPVTVCTEQAVLFIRRGIRLTSHAYFA